MTHLIRAMTLVASVALASAANASDTQSSPAAPTVAEGDPAPTWSQTPLRPEPELQEQVKATKDLLDSKEAALVDLVARLKTEGHLDRRSSLAIPSALENARATMTKLAAEVLSGREIPGGTARTMARELGVAADTLARQADRIGMVTNDTSSPVELQQQLAQDLQTTSDLLRSTAHGIIENLN